MNGKQNNLAFFFMSHFISKFYSDISFADFTIIIEDNGNYSGNYYMEIILIITVLQMQIPKTTQNNNQFTLKYEHE